MCLSVVARIIVGTPMTSDEKMSDKFPEKFPAFSVYKARKVLFLTYNV